MASRSYIGLSAVSIPFNPLRFSFEKTVWKKCLSFNNIVRKKAY